MKEMRRLLALVLCFVMLVGILPVSAFATDTVPAETSVVETTEAPTNAVEDDDVADDDPEEVIDSNIVPADNTTAPADNTLTKATLDASAGIALAASEDDGVAPAAIGTPVVVIAGSDYQQNGTAPKTNTQNILNAIKKDYATANGFIFGGDYSQTFNNSTSTTSGINELKGVVQGVYGTGMSEVYVQGNHDAAVSSLTATGAHDTDSYGVFSINEDDFTSGYNGTGTANSSMLSALESYLDGKVNDKYSKPIFVATHLPLHETSRNDNNGANAIFTLLNEAGGKGLNIIFLFGHNHSQGYDAYLGNGSIYLPKGSSISVEGGGTSTLNFTYMNNGYVGYVSGSACTHLTMTTFEIYEDEVIVKRYDANGEHTCGTTAKVLKAAGVSSNGYTADTTVVNSGASIKLTTPTGGSGDNSGTTPELPGDSEETVVGNATVNTAEDGSWQTVSVGTTTTTTKTKTVYVLSSGNPSGNVLIADRNTAGNVHLVANDGGDLSNVTTEVIYGDCDGDGDSEYYIELTSAEATNSLWTVSNSYRFQNQGEYLRYSSGLSVSSSYTNWSYSSNRLRCGSGSSTRYLRYNNDWTTTTNSGSAASIYFYTPTTVEYEEETSTSVTYSVTAEDVEYFIDESLTDTITASTNKDANATFTYEVVGGDDIIDSIGTDGTIRFKGTEGTAQVKVSYSWTDDDNTYTIWKVINVTATEPYYTVDILDGENVVTDTTITKKGITGETTLQLGTEIKFFGPDGNETLEEIPEGAALEWSIPEEYQQIATVDQNGLVTFNGVSGAFYVMVTLTVNGEDYTAAVNISATTSQFSVPTDGTNDFPEYPNEGAIRFDKTATAVGNFSETGITQVELSMTGVPYTAGSEIDVVIMLDRSRSMNSNRINATVAATEAFIKGIVKNEDGSYNGNRIYLGYFMGATTYDLTDAANIGGTLATIDNESEFNALIRDLKNEYKAQMSDGGTDWQIGLERCEGLLDTAKTDGTGNNRQQFCVFMSDGEPSDFRDLDNQSSDHTTSSGDGVQNEWVSNNSRNSKYEYELYSTRMKGTKNITIYSVLLGETATQPQFLMNDLSGAAGETTNDTGSAMSKKDKYYYNVPDADAATDMENVFKGIAVSILQAATNVTVEDKITDEYTMIFDIPTGSQTISGVTNDFYIEFVKYTLDEDNERTDDVTSITKLYLQKTGNTLSAKDSTAPAFEQKVIGEKGNLYYWTTDNSYASKAAVSYTTAGTTYYFIPYGMERNEDGTAPANWYNMTSGAYANGTVDTTNMSNDLVIATPYFVYNAATRMLYWTVEKLDTAEYALRYFLYLDRSATEVGTNDETDPGSYPTNDHAYITYTNFRDNDCRQEFPVPQLTWSGAQVSYVFYLVNSAGQPINKSGQVVDFANATFVTDIYTENTVWNKGEDGKITADSKLGINWLAEELLPSDYKVYDENAQYQLHVYGNHDGTSNFDYFAIGGDTAANISSSLNTRLEGANTTASTVSLTTTKVYNTKAGQKITGYGTYTSEATDSISDEIILSGFDFYNTTVAFAVVWQPALVPDAVVVDYGLDVLINVVANDLMQNTVTGIGLGKEAYGSIAMNTGVSSTSELGTAALNVDGNTISIENENAIRFSQGDMLFQTPTVFYYESPVEFYENSNKTNGYMYSSVTVIPATTVYYEDDFVTLDSYTNNVKDGTSKWTTAGTVMGATQDQDRPGASQISAALDADNKYGHDSAYEAMSQYSMGSAKKITVNAATRGEATFTFYGTGFDVISMTSKDTGTLTVLVTDEKGNTVKSTIVDTYYGMNADGSISINNPDAIYQVPVIKIFDLSYGQYTVKITAGYNDFFNHAKDGSYDLYLDAIRIYDPTGNLNADANSKYVADGEGWPTYQELRNNIIAASNYSVTENADGTVTVSGTDLPGAIFIDCNDGTTSIADYVSYGPNNELYLAKDQAIAFKVTDADIADIQLGIKVANGDSVTYEINGDPYTVNTTTDMYYSILDYAKNSAVVTIKNVDGGILSLTNIKVTHTTAPAAASEVSLLSMDAESAGVALMMLRKAPAVEEEVPETTVPEVTEPETSVPEETEPETEETKPGKPNKEDKPEKETKPNKPGKEDKDDKETKPTKPTKPNKPNKPNNNDSAVVVHSYLNKLASAVKSFVTALLVRWF